MTLAVAIVGRPNVGKSTLFNRLAGRKIALVLDEPGVTRDRKEATGRLGDMELNLVDTAGFDDVTDESLEARMRRQTDVAIAQADVCIFLFDAREGVTPLDARFGQILRKSGKPVILAANKCEGKQGDTGLNESWSLGLGEAVAISAEHGEGMADLFEALLRVEKAQAEADELAVVEVAEADEEEGEVFDPDADAVIDPEKPVRIAFVGRPNAGKSTLLNGILNDDRFLTGPEAGITRDSVTVSWTWRDREIRLVDTAGLRRRARVQEKLEKMSTHETIHSIQFADVVVLVMDPEDAFEKQDVQIAGLALREGRGLVYAITKWDAIDDKTEARKTIEDLAERRIPQASGAPVVFVSGLNRRNLDKLMDANLEVHRNWSARVKTRDLNDWLGYIVQKHPPPAPDGKRIKPRYIAQIKTRPPTFVLMASRGDSMPETYKRYMVNELRSAFKLPGVPIRLIVKQGKNPYDPKG